MEACKQDHIECKQWLCILKPFALRHALQAAAPGCDALGAEHWLHLKVHTPREHSFSAVKTQFDIRAGRARKAGTTHCKIRVSRQLFRVEIRKYTCCGAPPILGCMKVD
eukprot:3542211-Amphidinium_carterae.1